jgi:hypothetical protein
MTGAFIWEKEHAHNYPDAKALDHGRSSRAAPSRPRFFGYAGGAARTAYTGPVPRAMPYGLKNDGGVCRWEIARCP